MRRIHSVFMIAGSLLVLVITALAGWHQEQTAEATTIQAQPQAVNAISCPAGYTVSNYVTGLNSPDGLAMSPSGLLYVSEEAAGRVTRINADTSKTTVLSGLNSPEGITFDPTGNLYVVEDVENGRLIRQDTAGVTTTLATDLLPPEGVTVAADGTIYFTQSGLQLVDIDNPDSFIDLTRINTATIDFENLDPNDFDVITDTLVSHVTALAPIAPFTPTTVITVTPDYTVVVTPTGFASLIPLITILDMYIKVDFLSFAGITMGDDQQLYVAAELSGYNTVTTTQVYTTVVTGSGTFVIDNVTVEFTSTRSIIQIDPTTGISLTHVSHLTATEDSRFLSSGQYPLYIAQEDIGGANPIYQGQVDVLATAAGSPVPFCEGFSTIEELFVAPNGSIYVSEDGSGSIIEISPTSCSAPPAPTAFSISHTNAISISWQGDNTSYDFMLWQSDDNPYLTPSGLGCQFSNDCQLITAGNSYTTAVVPHQFYTLSTINSCGITTSTLANQVGQFGYPLKPGS